MTIPREVGQMALDALDILAKYEHPLTKIQVRKPLSGGPIVTIYPHKVAADAAEALRAALAQPEQEPVAYKVTSKLGEYCGFKSSSVKKGDLVYTATPQREWQGLTDEEMSDLIWKSDWEPQKIARAIEAKLKEKNT